jgi:hypothetical protein
MLGHECTPSGWIKEINPLGHMKTADCRSVEEPPDVNVKEDNAEILFCCSAYVLVEARRQDNATPDDEMRC